MFSPDRRNILDVMDRKPQNRADFQRFASNCQRANQLRHAACVFPVLPYPTRPIVENTLADLGPLALDRNDQPGPDFVGRESVTRKPILNVDVSPCSPVVAGRIPNRESTARMCVNDKSWAPRSAGLSGPAFVQCGICALVAPVASRISRQGATSPVSQHPWGVPHNRNSGAGSDPAATCATVPTKRLPAGNSCRDRCRQ